MPRALSRLTLLLIAMLALTACIEDLDSPTIVRTPRVLAIAVEPPEVVPGEDARVAAMFSLPEDVAQPVVLRWRTCLDPESVLEATGIHNLDLPGPPVCDEQNLAPDVPYVVTGERTARAISDLRTLAMVGGFDSSSFEILLATSGLTYFVDLSVVDANGEVVVSAFKRAAMTTRAEPTSNPPPPTFRLGEMAIRGAGDPFAFTCAPEGGGPVTVAPGARLALVPVLPDGAVEEPWLETFPVFDFTGGLTTAKENAYYTWLATAGSIDEFTTRPPNRESEWTAPGDEGPQTLWLVVRDGHLGASGCRLDVEVTR